MTKFHNQIILVYFSGGVIKKIVKATCEERIILGCTSQSITERWQGRNLKEKPRRNTGWWAVFWSEPHYFSFTTQDTPQSEQSLLHRSKITCKVFWYNACRNVVEVTCHSLMEFKAHSLMEPIYDTETKAKTMRLHRSRDLGEAATAVLLKECSNKMAPNGILLFPQTGRSSLSSHYRRFPFQ